MNLRIEKYNAADIAKLTIHITINHTGNLRECLRLNALVGSAPAAIKLWHRCMQL
jgi:hypothetical protein